MLGVTGPLGAAMMTSLRLSCLPQLCLHKVQDVFLSFSTSFFWRRCRYCLAHSSTRAQG